MGIGQTISDVLESVFSFFFGVANELFLVLVAVAVLDYVTGVAAAIHAKKVSSKIGAKGIAKKIMMFAVVSLSHLIDGIISSSEPPAETLQTITTLFYISNESISVLENVSGTGLDIPQKMKDLIAKWREKIGKP